MITLNDYLYSGDTVLRILQKYIQDSQVLWKDYTEELPICTIGATIGTHVGPNAVAVAFFGKEG